MSGHDLTGLTVCAVHAHPDDEAIWTGGLLAHLSRRGADVAGAGGALYSSGR